MVHFDLSSTGQSITAAINQRRVVTPIPQRASKSVAVIEILHISAANTLHDFTNCTMLKRNNKQMYMVCQQQVGMHQTSIAFAGFSQFNQVETIIFICNKNNMAIVTANNNVLWLPNISNLGKCVMLKSF